MWEISIPDPNNPGLFREEGMFDTREEAIKWAQETWGADEEGRVSLINEIPDESDYDDDFEDED